MVFTYMHSTKACSDCVNIGWATLSINTGVKALIIMELNGISFSSTEARSTMLNDNGRYLLTGLALLFSKDLHTSLKLFKCNFSLSFCLDLCKGQIDISSSQFLI